MKFYWDYIREFMDRQQPIQPGRLLKFKGISAGKHVYNPALIIENGVHYLAARVESPESFWLNTKAFDPEIHFFKEKDGVWEVMKEAPVFALSEDPSSVWITDEDDCQKLIFGRVIIDRSTAVPEVVTEFFMADSIFDLDPTHPFTEVRGMKDVRLLQLPEGDIAVCGRPVGGPAQHGRVSFTRIKTIKQLNSELVWKAPLLAMDLDAHSKVGNNELYLIPSIVDPKQFDIGVLGHLATGKEGIELHYAIATWRIDLQTNEATNPKVCVLRNHLELLPGKYHWINDVLFPGSLRFLKNDLVEIYTGLGDSATGVITIPNPFM